MDDFLRTLLEALPLPIVALDRDANVTFWNAAAEGVLGWKEAEVIGRPYPAVSPDAREDFLKLLETAFAGVITPRVERRRVRRDGSVVDVVLTIAPVRGADGAICESLAVLHDLTEVREAQRRYRLLLDGATAFGVLIVSPEGRIVDGSRGAEELLGWTRGAESAAFGATHLYPDAAAAELAVSREQGRLEAERWYIRPDGSRFWADVFVTAARDATGAVTDYIVEVRDASDRKRAQDQLERRVSHNAAVAAFTHRAISERDRDILARAALEHAGAALQADRVELLQPAADGTMLEIVHIFGWEPLEGRGALVPADGEAIQAQAFAHGGVAFRALAEADFESAPHLRGMAWGAAVAVGDAEAYVLAAFSRNAPFDIASIYPLQSIGAMFAAAMAHAAADERLYDRERRLELVLNQMPAILSTYDTRLRFTSITGAGLRILGIAPNATVGSTLVEYFGFPEDSSHVQAIRAAVRGEATQYDAEYQGRIFDNRVEPLRDRDGRIDGAIQLGIDVTDARQVREELRRLATARNLIQEEERRRIAREVHDELGQRLTALRIDLGLLRGELRERSAGFQPAGPQASSLPDDEPAGCRRTGRQDAGAPSIEERIATMFALIDETISTVRRVAMELRPAILDDFGFRAAVEHEVETFARRTGIDVRLSIEPEDLAVDSARATALYRIVQEALTNVARHSGATQVRISIEEAETGIVAELCDDGRGITPAEAASGSTLGLMGVRERAWALGGEARIEGLPGGGTRVVVTIPA